jgi:hypothetical protein
VLWTVLKTDVKHIKRSWLLLQSFAVWQQQKLQRYSLVCSKHGTFCSHTSQQIIGNKASGLHGKIKTEVVKMSEWNIRLGNYVVIFCNFYAQSLYLNHCMYVHKDVAERQRSDLVPLFRMGEVPGSHLGLKTGCLDGHTT